MKKAEDIKEFIERIDAAKKINPKDLSSDQDLTIAIMNLISIEEHLVFSGAKTEKTSFYDMVENIRELRKTLMQKIIPQYEGEVWCISKHLLSSSMRLMEVGTKQQSLGNKEEAYQAGRLFLLGRCHAVKGTVRPALHFAFRCRSPRKGFLPHSCGVFRRWHAPRNFGTTCPEVTSGQSVQKLAPCSASPAGVFLFGRSFCFQGAVHR